MTTDLLRTANRVARMVTLAGAAVATVLLVAESASGAAVGGVVVVELLWVTPFAVPWLGLRFRPASLPLSVALGAASGLGLCVYSAVLFEVLFLQNSVLGYVLILVPFVQLGWSLFWIALIWWLGDASGAVR
ncbi:MAG TPA: hypothetical protein VFT38_15865 [Vicinamibacteria bacterium]|nr:hypothetical protein [Vicinamibacteria bacterium]